MTPGQILKILALAEPSLTARGLLDAGGNFVNQSPLVEAEDVALVAQDVEAALKAQGVVIDSKIDKIIQVAPAMLLLAAQLA